MSELPKDDNESPFRELAETIVQRGQAVAAYRDFIGRKKAALIISELGIDTSGDEMLETLLTDIFGTCVTTGMVLSTRNETDDDSFDANVERLTEQLPDSIRPTLARFVPYLIDQGITFQQDIRLSDELLEQWDAEFKLLQSIPSSN